MKTTPETYFNYFVLGNFDDFKAAEYDVRLAFNACVSAFQFRDIYFNYYKREDSSKISKWKDVTEFVRYLEKEDPNFTTVQSVATAYKHLVAKGGQYDIVTPGDVFIETIDDEGKTISLNGEGRADRHGVLVRSSRYPDSPLFLLDVLDSVVMEMWPKILAR